MDSIVPCRSCVSERFPVASFAIRAPQPRYFEVVCATDPRLLHTDNAARRTPSNFYSSRADGLLFAERGDATWIVPPQALARFAGSRRLFYALGTYGGRHGEDPRFTIAPTALERVPSIGIAADFTGRSLDRRRIGAAAPARATYGAASGGAVLRWGGDAVLEAERTRERSQARARIGGYDDGYGESPPAEDVVDDRDYAGDSVVESGALGLAAEAAPTDEPEYEDAAELYASEAGAAGQSLGARAARLGAAYDDDFDADDQDDDDDERYGRRGPRVQPQRAQRYRRAVAQGMPATTGRHASYREEDIEESLAIGPAAHALSARPLELVPFEIADKVRILRVVGRAESGDDGYSAVAADPEYETPTHPAYHNYHIGLSWGFIQFTQRGGALGRVLRLAKNRESVLAAQAGGLAENETFASLFGPAWSALLQTTDPEITGDENARVAPVDGTVLWQEPWLARFRQAGAVAYVQAAQNEAAVLHYCDPILPLANGLGLTTPRAIALLIDRAVHMGVGGARTWIMRTVGVIRSESDREAALRAVGCVDLTEFQRSAGLVVDGQWGPQSHAALMGALRMLGSAAPVEIPPPERLLAQLRAAAAESDFATRMLALFDNRTDFDDSISYRIDGR